MTDPIRVLVADDQPLLRRSFRLLVDTAPGLTAVGEAGTGAEAVERVRQLHPEVVLMDIRMPDLDGIEATRRIAGSAETAGTRILVLTTFDLDAHVFDALRAGASGFLLKDVHAAELLRGIRIVAAGESVLAPSATRRLLRHYAGRPSSGIETGRVPAELNRLTARERSVLGLLASGLNNTEIAADLGITVGTVKSHVNAVLRKLALRDRVQATILAYDLGLARPHPPGTSL